MNYSTEEILKQAEALAEDMRGLDEIAHFHQLEAKLNENKKVQTYINQIKMKQKQAVNLQAYGKREAQLQMEQEIDELQAKIDSIPIVQDFKESQVITNHILQSISQNIQHTVFQEEETEK
ncbi:RicAFT regulatory complex protein RicA family protein [Terribacillus sp. DMT04]|uniref:RicAFT regulatory complex protein RicA family protein n=1 Tax=Terribacillus sp. DMT04 TaxID=2850441 RepID=UPI001C2C1109|nr:YlbF family regulator [Terribacillus sp. DMT04]QXE03168.1 YlbF family regulator [Terribacillus sp. DMT04]